MRFFRRKPVIVKQGDLFQEKVDVIVNPANEQMMHGGGLAYQFSTRGGMELVEESLKQAPVDTGTAIATTGGHLPYEAVIHTVGPVWSETHAARCDRQLKSAHMEALRLAHQLGCESIAFPAVSCGIFHYPVDRAAPIAVAAALQATNIEMVRRVVFCLFEAEHLEAYQRALRSQR